jgi:broad specificity polyphosphatase/5'/3'-nucleotidase SurE
LIRQSINEQVDKRTDIWAINQGGISITPLHLFLENRFPTSVLEKMISGLLEEVKNADSDRSG